MQTRYTDAIPLAPHPNLDQYRILAKDLVKASRNGDASNIRGWAVDWLERLGRSQDSASTTESTEGSAPRHLAWQRIDREADEIVRHIGTSRLLESDARPANVTLSEAQLVVARLHGFESWPKFAHHIEARDNSASPVSQFESAADAIVSGDAATLRT